MFCYKYNQTIIWPYLTTAGVIRIQNAYNDQMIKKITLRAPQKYYLLFFHGMLLDNSSFSFSLYIL